MDKEIVNIQGLQMFGESLLPAIKWIGTLWT